ncbi:hypothetical protein H17ap60334_08780 [Thermosipho africanus H17ap60334]|jgi:hypothetical protein|uniref:DUF3783 domain-containing protein n=1 Tax=Thermosipho africanus (strain TCF52B) TaxID=484019 RepID=B7IF04_THEAB|nr:MULTISPECIES: DUF3783 domain-containing protein [Thermosipho]ACJ74668.1 conserved hypothetical protein [Thermosipho africanus TCF52B]EKF48905.1 hypothetical protein H17ap60334_08780 [Thermosipho africanus H17ap60334]MBZ4649781.1 hypothetical protein [Thermosipho sp. (in: thermotogales)]MDK2900656.1 hypothetical protein [Thermosipho sp. (in: thermotogales)]
MKEKAFLIIHGFEKRDELFKLIKLLKDNFPEKELIFATTTPTNLEWKLSDLIVEIEKEHEFMKKTKQK